MHLEILDSSRQKLFYKLSFSKKMGLYLAGGTALAFYLNHRTSVDFDFYTQKHFKKEEFSKILKKNLPDWSFKIIRDYDDTFEIEFKKGIRLSCFYYPYQLLKKPINIDGVLVASLNDLAAMKLVAVSQRGKQRDFIDIYYLIQQYGLPRLLNITQQKYSEFDVYNGLRGLLYFNDAEQSKDISRIRIFDKKLTWSKVKKYIFNQVKNFQKYSKI